MRSHENSQNFYVRIKKKKKKKKNSITPITRLNPPNYHTVYRHYPDEFLEATIALNVSPLNE